MIMNTMDEEYSEFFEDFGLKVADINDLKALKAHYKGELPF